MPIMPLFIAKGDSFCNGISLSVPSIIKNLGHDVHSESESESIYCRFKGFLVAILFFIIFITHAPVPSLETNKAIHMGQ